MSGGTVYELCAPTKWAEPPRMFSYSSLRSIRSCPRRWLLLNSVWGDSPKFPQRYAPSAVEGRIVHEALDRLARALGRAGSPPIGSPAFARVVDGCGFWEFFVEQVSAWNEQITLQRRLSSASLIRAQPMDLANRAIRLLREQYQPDDTTQSSGVPAASWPPPEDRSISSLLSLLAANGTLSERELRHPSLPVVGILDLIRSTDDGVLVVDFKTGTARPEHREQVELYALLWWRNTGEMPARIAVQYLNGRLEWSVTREKLESYEATLDTAVADASRSLCSPPGEARPSGDCSSCIVRARCDEGWTFTEGLQSHTDRQFSDVEVVVASPPSPTGFLIRRSDGTEVSLVFDASVAVGLPRVDCGDRIRLTGVLQRGPGELELTRSTELYRLDATTGSRTVK